MTRIIFTSCIRYEAFKSQPEWEDISNKNPDYLFLLGDTIYMDYGLKVFSKEPIRAPEKYSNSKFKELMEKKYQNQFLKVPEFKKLIERMRRKKGFYAIWDDHDFAWDNSKGSEVCLEKKNISRSLFHKYTKCSTNKPHVYYHVDLPTARAIFIDNRTDAEKEGRNNKLISDLQFEFIAEKLNHDLKYTLICGGLTLTSGHENWTKYPSQLQDLCHLLQKKKNVIFLGGDIHKNKFIKPKTMKKLSVNTPVQLISSGMQVNCAGLGISLDDQHNWAMLDLGGKRVSISFYNKNGLQIRKSEKANKWFQENF